MKRTESLVNISAEILTVRMQTFAQSHQFTEIIGVNYDSNQRTIGNWIIKEG